MFEKIESYFEKHKGDIIEDIAALVEIPSVKGEPMHGKPFGYYPFKALETALEMAGSYGLVTNNYDGYIGSIDFDDKTETALGIFAHLDVVAAGDGWHTNPYSLHKDDEKIYGRGVSDDKGPAIAALYAMRAVKDLGFSLNKNVRLILGTDEECGSSDLEHYFKTQKAPKYSFTPDANFPVVNGEKGRFSKSFFSGYIEKNSGCVVSYIKGGIADNAVPDYCEALVLGADLAFVKQKALLASTKTRADFAVEEAESGVKIICNSVSAHASLAHLGNNAITAMLFMLSTLELDDCQGKSRVCSLHELFPHGDYKGSSFGVEMKDFLGELTLSLNKLSFMHGRVEGFFDSRTPMKANEENCAKPIAARLAEHGFSIENTKMVLPHYVDSNSPFIKTLLKNYEKFTGENGECESMGGGTYVHGIDGAVAFGAIRKNLNTNMHGANEFMYIEDIITAAKIYAAVIIDMCR